MKKFKHFKLISAGLLIVLGIGIGFFWLQTYNNILGLLSIGMCTGSFFLIRSWFRSREEGDSLPITVDNSKKKQGGEEVPSGPVNSLCLYEDKVVFASVKEPPGQPSQCLNDKKFYHILEWNEEQKKLLAFALPDQQYYDPIVFAQRVLSLPSHRRLLRRKESLFQKLSPFILVLAIIIVWIIIITTTG